MASAKIPDERQAGSPSKYLAERADILQRDATGERVEAVVPCVRCTACCYHKVIPVITEQERPEDMAKLSIVPGPDGYQVLDKREDGGCIHLRDNQCSVWPHRPRACRMFDCRTVGIIGIATRFQGKPDGPIKQSPVWRFAPKDHDEELTLRAMELGAQKYLAEHVDGDPYRAYAYAKTHLAENMAFIKRLTEKGRGSGMPRPQGRKFSA